MQVMGYVKLKYTVKKAWRHYRKDMRFYSFPSISPENCIPMILKCPAVYNSCTLGAICVVFFYAMHLTYVHVRSTYILKYKFIIFSFVGFNVKI
jgi:hypothetical protein